jgi:hypothetical protein
VKKLQWKSDIIKKEKKIDVVRLKKNGKSRQVGT